MTVTDNETSRPSDYDQLTDMAVAAYGPGADIFATQAVGEAIAGMYDKREACEESGIFAFDRASDVGTRMGVLIEDIRKAYPEKRFVAGAIVEKFLWGYEKVKGKQPVDWQMMAAVHALYGEPDLTLTLSRLRIDTVRAQFSKRIGKVGARAIADAELSGLGEN